MKKIIALITIIPFLGFASIAQADLKVGTVDMNKIFKAYWKTKQAEDSINQAKDSAKKELDDKFSGYKSQLEDAQKLQSDLQKNELSKEKKASEAKELQTKAEALKKQEIDLQAFRQQREGDLQKRAVEMRNDIVKEIQAVVNEKAKSGNYDLIFDTSGSSLNGVPMVVFAKSDYDFSDDVIAELNKTKPASTTKSKSQEN